MTTIIYSTIGILQRDAPPAGQETQDFLTGQEAMAKDFCHTWRHTQTLIEQLDLEGIKWNINRDKLQEGITTKEREIENLKARLETVQSRYLELTDRLLRTSD